MLEGNHFKEGKTKCPDCCPCSTELSGDWNRESFSRPGQSLWASVQVRGLRNLEEGVQNQLARVPLGCCILGIQAEQMSCSNKIWIQKMVRTPWESAFWMERWDSLSVRDKRILLGATGFLLTVKRKTRGYWKKLFFCSRLESFLPLLKPFNLLFISCLWIN